MEASKKERQKEKQKNDGKKDRKEKGKKEREKWKEEKYERKNRNLENKQKNLIYFLWLEITDLKDPGTYTRMLCGTAKSERLLYLHWLWQSWVICQLILDPV